MKNIIKKRYKEIFKETSENTFFSPSRVNLIGEHIDYNGGYVLPAALSYGTYGVANLTDDKLVSVFSNGFSQKPLVFSIDNLKKSSKNIWINYLKGVFKIMLDENYKINKGINLYIHSNMPTSAGLSSSASLELLIIVILNDLFNLGIDKKEMALIGQKVENNYLKVNSGIMDQFSIIMGKKDHAIFLNTQTLKYTYLPFQLNDLQLVIINTNKKRGLTDSKYNQRFSECRRALKILQETYSINHLVDLDGSKLQEIQQKLNDEILYKRVKHVITEQARTIESRQALKDNNLTKFAKLMISSHESLKEDYDVTGFELDTLVEETLALGAIGARMTGAGFGGCIVAIVEKTKLDDLIVQVKRNYQEKTGYLAEFYLPTISDGTKRI